MKTWTYEEARDKLLNDADLQDDETDRPVVETNELIGYFNEGIDEAEADIHKLHEDYFLTPATLTLASGTADYAYPSDIYGHKIRGMWYVNGSRVYEIKRLSKLKTFGHAAYANINASATDDLRWLHVNTTASGPKIRMYPTPAENGAYVQQWYLRNAARLPLVGEAKSGGGNYTEAEILALSLDIPEFVPFVIQWVKVKIMGKEGDPRYSDAVAELTSLRKTMVDTLTQMAPDDNDEVPPDFSHYEEHT